MSKESISQLNYAFTSSSALTNLPLTKMRICFIASDYIFKKGCSLYLNIIMGVFACVCVYARARESVCVCVCARLLLFNGKKYRMCKHLGGCIHNPIIDNMFPQIKGIYIFSFYHSIPSQVQIVLTLSTALDRINET